MTYLCLVTLLGMWLVGSASAHTLEAKPTACEDILLSVDVLPDGQLRVNDQPADRAMLRDAARRTGQACAGQTARVSMFISLGSIGFGDDLDEILAEEISDFDVDQYMLMGSTYLHTTPPASFPGPADPPQRMCNAIWLHIAVDDDETVSLNNRPTTLEAIRLQARNKAVACRGATPTGTYEGPNHVTVIASMIWPILREELPDLELETSRRGP